jgi:outer membrane lipoprotein SlyB
MMRRTIELIRAASVAVLLGGAAPGNCLAQRSDAVAVRPVSLASSAAPRAFVAADSSEHHCRALCGGVIGTLAGAALGAGARTIAVYQKPSNERDIGDGPSIALCAILGGVVGGLAGVIIGASR